MTRTDAWRRACAITLAVTALAAAAGGCGGDDEARSEQRPPVPINVSILIGPERMTASPDTFGAGPVTLLVSNQSGAAQSLTVEGPRLRRSVGPIPPDDTATVKVTMATGDFTVSAEEDAGIEPAALTVGAPRDTAQNELLLP